MKNRSDFPILPVILSMGLFGVTLSIIGVMYAVEFGAKALDDFRAAQQVMDMSPPTPDGFMVCENSFDETFRGDVEKVKFDNGVWSFYDIHGYHITNDTCMLYKFGMKPQ